MSDACEANSADERPTVTSEVRIAPRPYTDGDVERMVAEVQQEYVGMYGGPDRDAVAAADLAPPDGLLLVASLGDAAVGMGGWRFRGGGEPGVAEIKRMYVAPAVRGRGLSRALLHELERSADAAGATRLVLCTGGVQLAAIGLYESSGYTPVAPFGHYGEVPGARFYGKSL